MKSQFSFIKNLNIEPCLPAGRNSMKIENFKLKILLICLLGYLFIGLFSLSAEAQSSSSDNFNIEIQDLRNAEDAIVPNINQEVVGDNKSQTTITSDPFSLSFAISNSFIDFGQLSPTTPVTRNLLLSISAESTGYQIKAYKNNPLKSGGNMIPDTTCDNGACSHLIPSLWENNLTYGFGFRCENIEGGVCEKEFETNHYKQFADLSEKDRFQSELTSNFPIKNAQAKIAMKVNIAGSLAPGTYSNTVTYIAVPNF